MKRTLFLIFICLVLVAGCRGTGNQDAVVTFKNGSLTESDLKAHYNLLKGQRRYRENPEQLTREFVFDHALNMEMIIAKGLKEKLHQDPRVRAEIHNFMSDLFLKVMESNLVSRIDKTDFSDQEIEAFYTDHIDSYTIKPRYSVSIIKTKDKAEAVTVLEKIKAGEVDFSEAARRYSLDDRSKLKGGAIGSRTLRRFKPSWRPVIKALVPGEVSRPQTIDGQVHLLLLTGKTESFCPSFEEKKAYVRNDLLLAKYREAWQGVYDELKQAFGVKVDEKKLDFFLNPESKEG